MSYDLDLLITGQTDSRYVLLPINSLSFPAYCLIPREYLSLTPWPHAPILSWDCFHTPNYQDHGPGSYKCTPKIKNCPRNFNSCPHSVSVPAGFQSAEECKLLPNCLPCSSPRGSFTICVPHCSKVACASLAPGGPSEPGRCKTGVPQSALLSPFWALATTPAFLDSDYHTPISAKNQVQKRLCPLLSPTKRLEC